jgi:site-specific DNA-cytosine methylase
MNYISIVPLIGGFTLGAEKATGKKPQALISYPPFAANDANIAQHYGKDVPYIHLPDDETAVQSTLSNYREIDIVTSTCPCAGLSQLNSSKSGDKARGADAIQNQWMYKSTEHILNYVQPKVLVGENAPALFTNAGEKTAERLFEIGKKFGYSFTLYKTTTSLHGIPQNRMRTFYFFWKSKTAPQLEYYNVSSQSLEDYLANVKNDADEVKMLENDILKDTSYLYSRDILGTDFRDKISKHGKTFYQYLIKTETLGDYLDYLNKNGHDAKAVKVAAMKAKIEAGGGYWDDSIHVFTGSINAIAGRILTGTIHPTYDRWFTKDELLHLMGMPPAFNVIGGRKNLNMIAQSVPVSTAASMVEQAAKFVNGELKMTDSVFNKQDNTKHKSVSQDIVEFN